MSLSFRPTSCIICLNPKAALCARCRTAHYCSRACQVADFPVHNVFCRAISDHARDPTKHRAFVFDPLKGDAQVVDHSCDYPIPTGHTVMDGPDPNLRFKRFARFIAKAHLRLRVDQYALLDYDIITTNVRTGLKLNHTLILFSRRDRGFQHTGVKIKKHYGPDDEVRWGFRCRPLTNIVSAAYLQPEYDLFGPFMLCSFGAEDGAPRDTTLEDLRHLVDYIGMYEQTRPEEWAQRDHAAYLFLQGDERVDRISRGRVYVHTRKFPDSDDPNAANMGGLELQCAQNMIVHKLQGMTSIGVTPDSPLYH